MTRHSCLLILAALAAALALFSPWRGSPILTYNASPSVAIGLYRRARRMPGLGALVTLKPPASVAAYARARGFGDPSDRFIKRVAAATGQIVCARGRDISIDGRTIAQRLDADSMGRALPHWRGCRRLGAEEFFLLGDDPHSFDGRYWGVTRLGEIDGVWRPL